MSTDCSGNISASGSSGDELWKVKLDGKMLGSISYSTDEADTYVNYDPTPEQVVEIAIDGIQASTRYPGGVALRFARVKRYRDDKSPVISAIVGIARGFDLNVIAEGVETVEQADALGDLGCDDMQGYLFCKPRPAAELIEFLRSPVLPGDLALLGDQELVTLLPRTVIGHTEIQRVP